MELQRFGQDLATEQQQQCICHTTLKKISLSVGMLAVNFHLGFVCVKMSFFCFQKINFLVSIEVQVDIFSVLFFGYNFHKLE